jgi:hypothetical protein
LACLKVTIKELKLICNLFLLTKEFDELQEKKIQVNEQFRTIAGTQQGTAMNVTGGMGYQGGRQQQQRLDDIFA